MDAITDDSGTLITQQRYLPFGGERELPNNPTTQLTDYAYTGQRALDPGMGGLMDYRARFFSPYLNRFLQPDTIISNPANPQTFNRYSYVTNRPINFNDPTGHYECEDAYGCDGPGDDNAESGVNNGGGGNPNNGGGGDPDGHGRHGGDQEDGGVFGGGNDQKIEKFLIIGTIAAQPAEDKIYSDEKVDRITNKGQWFAELVNLFVDLKDVFQPPPPAPRNVVVSMSYDEFENGNLDNFKFSIDNKSGVDVYVSTIDLKKKILKFAL
jgi:RHS repeat-associated protein